MKLMFWKKQTGTPEEPDAPGDQPGNWGSLAFSRLSGRMKMRLVSLIRHFRRAPPFRAEEGRAPDTPDISDDVGNTAQSAESPAEERPENSGLVWRIKAALAAFKRELIAPSAQVANEEQEAGPARPRRWLIVGGSILIVVLLASDIAVTLWLAYEPQPQRWGTRHIPAHTASPPGGTEAAPDETRQEVETLIRQNAELQARIEALQRESAQQRHYVSPSRQSAGYSPSLTESGETAVGTSDPKAAAMTLKEAIEAMNAGTGDYANKRAK